MGSRINQRAKRRLQFEQDRGYLGYLDPTTNAQQILDLSTGMYWVRPAKSTGAPAPAVKLPLALNAYVPEIYNLAVRLGYDPSNQLRILGVDEADMKQQGLNPALLNAARGTSVYLEQIVTLSCRKHPLEDWFAIVYPGVAIINGTVVDFAGGQIDLSSDIPSAGNHRYIGVYLDSTGALGLSSSTSQSTASALNASDLQEIITGLPADSIPLRAFAVTDTDTVLQDDLTHAKDMRSPWGWY